MKYLAKKFLIMEIDPQCCRPVSDPCTRFILPTLINEISRLKHMKELLRNTS